MSRQELEQLLKDAEESLAGSDRARAEALCRQALERAPGSADARRVLGTALLQAERAPEAIPLLREALEASPDDLKTLNALSAALMAVADYPEAERIVRRALAVDFELPLAHMRLGLALARQGKWSEATRTYQDVIERVPRLADAHHNLGDALTKLHRFPEALVSLRRALRLNPANPDTYNSIGVILQELRLWEGAIARYEQALALSPDDPPAHYNLGLARLFQHDFGQAWAGYDRRLECAPVPGATPQRKDPASVDLYFRLSRWKGPGEADVGEVAIWGEQGIGDQILYSTLLPELVGTGKPFLYEVDARLLPAYQRAFPGVRFFPLQDPPRAELQRASRVLMAGSLPGLFRATRASFSRQPARLLNALPERVAHYRKRLEALGPGLKVALSWRSTRQDWLAVNKNASLADMAPLMQLPGVHVVDVQYGDTAGERRAVEAATGARLLRFDEVDYYNDLEEVLAILEACDLLVTTSNANAHFAGALGKRTWLVYLEDRPPFHYWAHGGRYRSIWYPSVEIVSGVQFREWPALIAAVAQKLTSAGNEAPAARTAPLRADRLAHARALRGEGKVEEALAVCRRVIEEHPDDAQAWSELAHGLRWQDDWNGARSAAVRAIEIAPGLAAAWFNLGAVQVEQGETEAGIASYHKALEIEPEYAEAWSNLGGTLGAAGDNAGEIEAYLHAISVNPGLAPVWGNLGNALLEAGDVDEAIAACRRAVEVEAGFAAGWNNLGSALLAKGEHAGAIEACEKALALAPQLAEAHVNLGMALRARGRNAEAAARFRRALDLDPHHAKARNLLETMKGNG